MSATSRINTNVNITQMTKTEFQTAIDWAKTEGWIPGIHDIDSFYETDPTGFYAEKAGGEIVGTFSVVKYSKDYAFAGFFIVRPDWRGKGLGLAIQHFIDQHFGSFNVGIDGVLAMQEKYSHVGYKLAYGNERYAGIAKDGELDSQCRLISSGDFENIVEFDAKFFPTQRRQFLKPWLNQKDATALLAKDDTGKLCGYGVVRKCFQGSRVGPLFAETPQTAKRLFDSLAASVAGQEIFIDVPTVNSAALQLALSNDMKPVFTTARMYTKQAPNLPLDKIFGVTSLELG
ncbi:MAG TPA: GNAT family N-acetyltransferase [Candidatus Acidoferrales bacterium]|nr:GNAT family N-acetyltransferase [Candidatus Acidoferrales bacterium]